MDKNGMNEQPNEPPAGNQRHPPVDPVKPFPGNVDEIRLALLVLVIFAIAMVAFWPLMGIAGFIIGPVLIALVVTGARILAEECCPPHV